MTFTPSRPGLNDFGADQLGVLYEQFAGETIAVFEKNTFLMDWVDVVEMPQGAISISFPVINTGFAKYHSAGDNLLVDAGYLQQLKTSKRTLHADKALTASVAVDVMDEFVSAYSVRQTYSMQLGAAVGAKVDQQILRCVWNACDAPATFTGVATGYSTTGTTLGTQANALYGAIVNIKTKFDNNGVPPIDRVLVLKPEAYNLLLTADSNNSAFQLNEYYGGEGKVAEGMVARMLGFNVLEHNAVSKVNSSDTSHKWDAGGGNDYSAYLVSPATALGVAFWKHAVKLGFSKPLSVAIDYIPEAMSTLVNAWAAFGVLVVRPEAVARISGS